ncbi:MAG: thiamine phosphate synthase [bacterium]
MTQAIDFSLYAILDVTVLSEAGLTLEDAAEAAASGGASILQLRDKAASGRALFDETVRLLRVTRKLGVLLIVNDRADVAAAAAADGVHVGRDDLPVEAARAVLPAGAIVGATARSLAEAQAAASAGATYVGVGSLFASRTKSAPRVDARDAGEIAHALDIPVVAIGGIDESGAAELARRGLAGVAVCRALFDRTDVAVAARRIRGAFLGVTKP